MLACTKHNDVAQFSTPLVHDESRQHGDLFLETRRFARSLAPIAPMENREEKRQANDCFFQRWYAMFYRHTRDTMAMRVATRARECFINYVYKNLFFERNPGKTAGSRSGLSRRILDHERHGRKEISPGIFPLLASRKRNAVISTVHHNVGRFIKSI